MLNSHTRYRALGLGAESDPGVQSVSPQVTKSSTRR